MDLQKHEFPHILYYISTDQFSFQTVDLYALSKYANASKPSGLILEASQLAESKQAESKQKGADGENEKSELRLAQLHHQLLSNEPGALMHPVKDLAGEDEEDRDTRECKNLFKNLKFFLSREVRPFDSLGEHIYFKVLFL
jgi:pescadillo